MFYKNSVMFYFVHRYPGGSISSPLLEWPTTMAKLTHDTALMTPHLHRRRHRLSKKVIMC